MRDQDLAVDHLSMSSEFHFSRERREELTRYSLLLERENLETVRQFGSRHSDNPIYDIPRSYAHPVNGGSSDGAIYDVPRRYASPMNGNSSDDPIYDVPRRYASPVNGRLFDGPIYDLPRRCASPVNGCSASLPDTTGSQSSCPNIFSVDRI